MDTPVHSAAGSGSGEVRRMFQSTSLEEVQELLLRPPHEEGSRLDSSPKPMLEVYVMKGRLVLYCRSCNRMRLVSPSETLTLGRLLGELTVRRPPA